jgi:hypothetical protein
MNGVIGDRAQRPVYEEINDAHEICPKQNREVALAIKEVLRVAHATVGIAQLTAMRMTGVIGDRAQRPVVVGINTAVAL